MDAVARRRSGSYVRWSILLILAALISTLGDRVVAPVVRAQTLPVGAGFTLDAGDLRFIFHQIEIAQDHAAGGQLFGSGPNQVAEVRLPFGLRTVDGSFNHIEMNTTICNSAPASPPIPCRFGAGDQLFPRRTTSLFRQAEQFDPDGPGPTPPSPANATYAQINGTVYDSRPRVISNLIVDQTATNPAAVAAQLRTGGTGEPDPNDPSGTLFIPNTAPDVGLSAPFNIMFVFFGQFFDHGLDLLDRSPTNMVVVPLRADDPLINGPDGVPGGGDDLPPNMRFMAIARGRVHLSGNGPDGIANTADDIREAKNKTTPFVDQNQTYTSHPSHQVFLREYQMLAGVGPVPNGKVLDGVGGHIGNWGEVKAQALTMLGIRLVDADVFDVPLLLTDPYGHFIPGAGGFPQIVTTTGLVVGTPAGVLVPGNALRTGHAFLDDIAHNAIPRAGLTPDADLTVGPTDPILTGVTTYDNELLDAHFVTGDGRGNENIALTAVHTIFHSEHNRLAAEIAVLTTAASAGQGGLLTPAEAAAWRALHAPSGWRFGERLFQAARFVTEMQYQHLVFEEFARKVSPSVNEFIGDGINFQADTNPAIVAEFAHQVYRFGHSMLTETISRVLEDGTVVDIPLLTGFLNPQAFNNVNGVVLDSRQAAGAVFQGGTRQVANEIDEFKTEALRNNLLGLPLDLATINLARGRSEGVTTLNQVRRQLYEATGDSALFPYQDWKDFEFGMRNRESVINYLAAYGTHPSITSATTVAAKRAAATTLYMNNDAIMFELAQTSGLDEVDLWVGGLAEKQAPFGGLLGSTFNAIFELQLENLQNADRFYYLERLDGLNLLAQLEGNSFSELIARNTNAGSAFSADVFGRPDLVFNLANLGENGPIPDDPTTPDDESLLDTLIRLADGTFRFLGGEHVIWNGRDLADAPDRIVSSEGDDTLRGFAGNDRMEGGAGNDQFLGGEGDDILLDSFGEDNIKGGPGNDAISGGLGPFDLLQGNEGNDYIVGGNDVSEVFGGPGNDVIYTGDGPTEAFGDTGDDWIEGGPQLDLLVGDSNNQFQDDPNGGHDVIIGNKGDDDYDSEGGDDIMVADVLGTERLEGMRGFDWVTYRGDPLPVDADMSIRVVLPPNLDETRDRFDLAEALSGWRNNDILRGDDRGADPLDPEAPFVGHELTLEGINRIAGLQTLLGGATSFANGNIILGGEGSDVIEGRGGNDLIDGDAWLNVQLGVANTPERADNLFAFRSRILSGALNPGLLQIFRSIVTPTVPTDCPLLPTTPLTTQVNCDTAVFSGNQADYTVVNNGDGTITVTHVNVGPEDDGTDTLRNIERLQFADVTISPPASVAVTLAFPIGGERLFVNVPTTIRWNVTGTASGFTVQLLTGTGAATDICVGQNLGPSVRSCAWTPTAAATGLRVRVNATGGGLVSDVSGAGFNVVAETPVITVTQPQGGASLVVGQAQNIRWNHNLGSSASVRVEVLRGTAPNQTVQVVSPSFKNTGDLASVFSWVVTGPTSSSARVRVTWLDGPTTHTGPAFTIAAQTVRVTAPNGGETFIMGGSHAITWNHTMPPGGRVNIDVTRAFNAATPAATVWTPIALNVPNATGSRGTFSWVVSGPATTTARIRVRSAADDTVVDRSNANFTIGADLTPPSVAVTAPSAGGTVSGSTVALAADASDDLAVASVQFMVDGINVGNPDTVPPYTINWDSTTASNAVHGISARAVDVAGRATTSEVVNVMVSNLPVTIITFNDLATANAPLTGQYPSGVVDWGSGGWWGSGPWGQLTTNSVSFTATGVSRSFTFITPRRLVSVKAFNGGSASTTVTLSCAGNPTKTTTVAPNQLVTITTAWSAACSTVTVGSTNGWDTNFDDLAHSAAQ